MELGDAMNGHARTLHGGVAAVLLDEVCGLVLVLNSEKRFKRPGNTEPFQHYMTACESVGRGIVQLQD
jgi:hypothetical protein